MKEIGLFYAMNAAKTSHIAEKIREKLGHKEVEMIMIEKAWQNDFQAYDNLIVGASTWFDGEIAYLLGRNDTGDRKPRSERQESCSLRTW